VKTRSDHSERGRRRIVAVGPGSVSLVFDVPVFEDPVFEEPKLDDPILDEE
jgi:hypothetical protein